MKNKVQVIVPAAGAGTRFKSRVPKSLVLLNGSPLIVHCLKVFDKSPLIDGVVLVVPSAYLKNFLGLVKKWKIKKVFKVIEGGKTRSESVYRGLCETDENTKFVLVHDGARPLVNLALINRVVSCVKRHDAVISAVPVKPTIKEVDQKRMVVKKTLHRSLLWEVQTPQAFKRNLLVEAHEKLRAKDVSDCASLIELIGKKVKVVMGDYCNIKVTTKEDLKIAQLFLRA